ncbi:MAG: hypothetical protein V1645_01935 [archaeon]
MVMIDKGVVNGFLGIPIFSRLVSESGYKSVGVKIVDNNKVVRELTSSYVKKKVRLTDGIKDPDFVVSVDYKFLKSLDKKKLDWIKANPVKAYFRYHDKLDVPFFVKLRVFGMLRNEA